jgi:hypothetical protein
MIVVADTGPLHYLVLIGAADVLPPLYHRVVTPQTVLEELSEPGGRRMLSKPGSRTRRRGWRSDRTRHSIPRSFSSIPANVRPSRSRNL